MEDSNWTLLEEPWDRLRWARNHWQKKTGGPVTARAAAEALGLQENTYTTYERAPAKSSGARGFSPTLAVKFGKKFKVAWTWLLTGEGTPWDVVVSGVSPEQEQLIELTQGRTADELQPVVDFVQAALRLKAS
jgi:hypothetical protein